MEGLKTIKEYYNDTYKYEHQATLIHTEQNGDLHTLITDVTIFHPQGGG